MNINFLTKLSHWDKLGQFQLSNSEQRTWQNIQLRNIRSLIINIYIYVYSVAWLISNPLIKTPPCHKLHCMKHEPYWVKSWQNLQEMPRISFDGNVVEQNYWEHWWELSNGTEQGGQTELRKCYCLLSIVLESAAAAESAAVLKSSLQKDNQQGELASSSEREKNTWKWDLQEGDLSFTGVGVTSLSDVFLLSWLPRAAWGAARWVFF